MIPKTSRDFWVKKLSATKERDIKNEIALTEAGWRVITVWECRIKRSPDDVTRYIILALK